MQVEVVSPERITYSGVANKVLVRTVGGGDIEFLPGHVPFIGVLQVSAAKIVDGDDSEIFAIHQGFVQMSGDKVTILSRFDDLDGRIGLVGRYEDVVVEEAGDHVARNTRSTELA